MDEASKSNTFKIEMRKQEYSSPRFVDLALTSDYIADSQQTQSFHKQTSEKLAEMDSGINALKDLFNVYLERKESKQLELLVDEGN